MELDGEAYPLADLGLDVTIIIGADGTAEMNMGGDVDHRQCAMQDGALVAGTMVFTLRDGVLSLSEDGAMMFATVLHLCFLPMLQRLFY